MCARTTLLPLHHQRAGDALAVVADSIVPSIRAQPGCEAVLLLRAANGDAMTVTVWASAAEMEAAAARNYPLQIAKLENLLRSAPARETYGVVHFHVANPDNALKTTITANRVASEDFEGS